MKWGKPKNTIINPKTMLKKLKRLAKYGCNCPPWCHCLLCRVRRIAQTEQSRCCSEWPLPELESGSIKTRMIDWRGGYIEFAVYCNGVTHEGATMPPWYAIEITNNDVWGRPWYYWLDYCGPPQLYLTKKAAVNKAKELREQYVMTIKQIKVVRVQPIDRPKPSDISIGQIKRLKNKTKKMKNIMEELRKELKHIKEELELRRQRDNRFELVDL